MARRCVSPSSAALDTLVARLVLQALEPAALELSLQVAADVEVERQRLQQHWHQRLERVAMTRSAPVASTTPSNRKTGWWRARWNAVGSGVSRGSTVQAEYARFLAQQPVPLSGRSARPFGA